MLTIYGVYRSRASRTIWLANELGLPFNLVPVMQRYRLPDPPPAGVVHTKSPEFLTVNPNGHIPTIDDGGVVLHESLATTLYLAKKHGGPLAPADLAEDGAMTTQRLSIELLPDTIISVVAALARLAIHSYDRRCPPVELCASFRRALCCPAVEPRRWS